MYHSQCEVGGIIINQETESAITCSPLGKIPKGEISNYLK